MLFASKPQQWVLAMNSINIDVFDHKMLLLPFEAEEQKSIFIVIGAGNIRCYDKRTFKGDRPCIIHLNPCRHSESRHNSHSIAAKIRTWLNHLWRQRENNGDNLMAPFHKRSLPVFTPQGNYRAHIVVHCGQYISHNLSLLSSKNARPYIRSRNRCSGICS